MQKSEIEKIQSALSGMHGEEIHMRYHHQRYLERKAPYLFDDLLKDRKKMVDTLRTISTTTIPGYAAYLASETLKQIGEDERVETNPPSA